MLQKIVLRCTNSQQERASYNWGSLLHGALMERLPKDIADALHDENLRPFSQYVLPLADNKLEWNIGLWDDSISEYIVQAVMPISSININYKGMELEVIGAERKKQNERNFLARFFGQEPSCRRYELEFLTPCTHKSSGKYVLFPTPELMIQSLCMRFCAFSQEYSLADPKTMAQISDNLQISGYSLHSVQYHIESAKIFGYMGRVSLYIHGPDQLARLTEMLLSFSEYAGIGIKTALGMGGCRITPIKPLPEKSKI